MAKSARAATPDDRAKQNAASYLEIEARVNSKLCPPGVDRRSSAQQGRKHVAPYLGEREVNGTTYLLWEASGEYTLEDYIEMEDGWLELAASLGVFDADDPAITDDKDMQELHNELAAEVLRQLLEGLAYCHSCGIVHRDVKVIRPPLPPSMIYVVHISLSICMFLLRSRQTYWWSESKLPNCGAMLMLLRLIRSYMCTVHCAPARKAELYASLISGAPAA